MLRSVSSTNFHIKLVAAITAADNHWPVNEGAKRLQYLFAELLQKFTSHAARFGLAILQPYVRSSEKIKKDEEEKKKAQETNIEKK